MRKYLRFLLILLAVAITVGTFSSCKDTEEDLYNELKSDNISLEKALEEQESNLAALKAQVEQIKSCECDQDKIAELEELINKIDAQLGSDYGDKTVLERLNEIELSLIKYGTELESITGDIANIEADIITLTTDLDSAFTVAYTAYNQAVQNGADITEIKELIDSLKAVNEEIIARVTALETEYTTVSEAVAAIKAAQDELKAEVEALEARVAALEISISGIIVQGTYNPSFGSFSLPTGTQTNVLMAYYGTASSSFDFPTSREAYYAEKGGSNKLTEDDITMLGLSDGDFFSISSQDYLFEDDGNGNMNAGTLYVTVNPSSVDFTGRTLTLENSQAVESYVKLGALTSSDQTLQFGWTRAAQNAFYQASAYLPVEDISNVQKVSLNTTAVKSMVNELLTDRTSADFQDIAAGMISVVTSCKLDALAVKATNINDTESAVYSNYNLAATAVKPLSFTSLNTVQTKLGSATNTAFDRVYNVIDGLFSSLLNMKVWNQLENFNLSVDTDDINFSLDIDVSSIQKALDNLTITDIESIEVTKNEDLSGADVDDNGKKYYTYTVDVDGVKYTYYVVRVYVTDDYVQQVKDNISDTGFDFDDLFEEDPASGKYYVNVPVDALGLYYLFAYQTAVNTQTENELIEQLNEMLENIEDQLNGQTQDLTDILQDLLDELGGLDEEVNDAIADVLEEYIEQISDEINDMLASVKGLRSSISNYQSTVDNYIATIQSYVMKGVNNISAMAHPTLIVTTSDSEYLTPSKSRYAAAEVSSSVTLTPTSWTVELVAPICKKHVAVTNVYNGDASAQGGDSACKSALTAANSCTNMNTVLDGSERTINLTLQSGYTYEVAYSALDYAGQVITYKYYLKVK